MVMASAHRDWGCTALILRVRGCILSNTLQDESQVEQGKRSNSCLSGDRRQTRQSRGCWKSQGRRTTQTFNLPDRARRSPTNQLSGSSHKSMFFFFSFIHENVRTHIHTQTPTVTSWIKKKTKKQKLRRRCT